MLKPDLSSASLHILNTSHLTLRDFHYYPFKITGFARIPLSPAGFTIILWKKYQCGVYTGLTVARFAISYGGPAAKMLSADYRHEYFCVSCPASSRFVLLDSNNNVVVFDIF